MLRRRKLQPPEDRGPLRVMFVITSMPVGGMEVLLVDLIRRIDRNRILPELCCLKYFDTLGETLAKEIPAFTGLISNKYDVRVLGRLVRLLRKRRIDAVVTVGTGGDKMFWGRLAAWLAGVPVICSALHSTGLPDRVEFSNRLLAPITDAFIGVAELHGKYLAESEGCPAEKIAIVPNGVDVEKFHPQWPNPNLLTEWGIPNDAQTVGIVAALRPEKNHELFLQAAAIVHKQKPDVHFLIAGNGPRRAALERMASELSLAKVVHFLGTRSNIPEILNCMGVFVLTSHSEANPVSILEAMACERPVVATHVGSVPETVLDGRTGYLVPPGDAEQVADRTLHLLQNAELAATLGRNGREQILARWSVERMVLGYEELIEGIYRSKSHRGGKIDIRGEKTAPILPLSRNR
jgi:glycosyltransferase involved in cell wall biosynthesis